MEKIKKGYTMWARETLESDIFYYKPDKWFKIWFFIVNKVNHKDTRLFKRGEGLITYEDISYRTKATRTQIEKCLKWLKKEDMIDERRTTRGNIKIVLKYNKFQDPGNYKTTQETNAKTIKRRIEDEQKAVPINKNVKNVKNVNKNIPPPLEEVKKYCLERNNKVDYNKWFNFYSSKGWMVGRNRMKDWKASVRTWEVRKTKNYVVSGKGVWE